jgi:hypothetical protein
LPSQAGAVSLRGGGDETQGVRDSGGAIDDGNAVVRGTGTRSKAGDAWYGEAATSFGTKTAGTGHLETVARGVNKGGAGRSETDGRASSGEVAARACRETAVGTGHPETVADSIGEAGAGIKRSETDGRASSGDVAARANRETAVSAC